LTKWSVVNSRKADDSIFRLTEGRILAANYQQWNVPQ